MLQIWLPLNNTLKNQGISGTSVINYGNAAFHFAGKSGSCIEFKKDPQYLATTSSVGDIFPSGSSFSVCLWVNSSQNPVSQTGIISANNYQTDGFGIGYKTNGTLTMMLMGSGTGTEVTVSYALPINEWHHIAYIYDAPAQKISLYVDGTLKQSSQTSFTWLADHGRKIYIGRNQQGGWPGQFIGRINDVRIYDHSLSLKELQELSLGLLLHYPLNQMDKQNCNIASHTNQGTAGWGWSMQAGDRNITEVVEESIRCCKMTRGDKEQSGWSVINYSNIRPSLYESGKKYTVSFEVYPSVNTSMRYTFLRGNGTDTLTSSWSPTFPLNSGQWNKISYTFTIITPLPDISDQCLYISGMNSSPGVSYTFRNLKIEPGTSPTPWCPASDDSESWFDGTEYNCAGLGFNAPVTAASSPFWYSGSPVYYGCYEFKNDCSKYLSVGNTFSFLTEFTWAFWMNCTGATGNSQYIVSNGRDYEKFGFNVFISGTSLKVSYGASSIIDTGINVCDGIWRHICITFCSAGCKIYINATLVKSGAYDAPDYTYASGGLVIGKMSYSYTNPTNYYPYNGKISDFRLYSTALAEADIKALYKTRFSLSSSGSLFIKELVEDPTNTEVRFSDNGIASSHTINELDFNSSDPNKKILPDGSTWLRIFHHNNHSGTVLFNSESEAMNCNTSDKYSALYLLEYYRNESGSFEFMAIQPELSKDTIYRWKQSNNPTNSSSTQGYINITNGEGGLVKCSGNTLCAKTSTTDNWWCAIGSQAKYGDGIPGFGNKTVTESLDLYVRVNNSESNKLKIFKNSFSAAEFIES